jgi:hypothetical protein
MFRGSLLATALFLATASPSFALTGQTADAVLVDDFVDAIELYATGNAFVPARPGVRLWLDGLAARGVEPEILERRLQKAYARTETESFVDPFARYRTIFIEDLPHSDELEFNAPPVTLHAFRFDVVEDYDDVSNDDIYCYFITTHDDVVWGKVTQIYTGLDEGTSFMFTPEDRGLFGPKGEKLVPRNHTLVDFGIVESDMGDIAQLKKVSDAIIDLALVALTIYNPEAGAAAAQARAETQNLMRLIVEMDDDDRLVVDTLRFTPDTMMRQLANGTVHEFNRFYDGETFWTHYTYRLHFRLMR